MRPLKKYFSQEFPKPFPLVSIGLMTVLGVMVLLFITVAWDARFVMDEFNLLQCIRSFSHQTLYESLDPIKTVLGTELFSIATIFTESANIMRASRFIALLGAMGTMVGLFLVANCLWGRSKHNLIVLICGLSFSNFFERAFRIRTDTFALTFAIWSLLFMVRANGRRWHLFFSGVLVGLSFLCTQKSIYFIFAYLIALIVATRWESNWKKTFLHCLIFGSGWAATFFIYAVYYGKGGWWRVIYMALIGPRFVMDGSSAFTGLDTFIHQTLSRNIIPYTISAVGLFIASVKWKSIDFPVRFSLVSTVIVTILIFNHNQPWPYVFVWPQAFLAIWVLPLIDWASQRGWLSRDRLLLVSTLLATLSLPRQIRYLNHTNHSQISVMAEAERLVEPGSTYFDGVGMVVNRDIAGNYPGWWWDTPTISRIRKAMGSGDSSAIRNILDFHPKLWIINYRIFNMSDIVQSMVADGYVRVAPNLLLSGIELKPENPETQFICRWPGQYGMYDETGRRLEEPFVLNNQSPAKESYIPTGVHRVYCKGAGETRFLLPVGATIRGPLPCKGPIPHYLPMCTLIRVRAGIC